MDPVGYFQDLFPGTSQPFTGFSGEGRAHLTSQPHPASFCNATAALIL